MAPPCWLHLSWGPSPACQIATCLYCHEVEHSSAECALVPIQQSSSLQLTCSLKHQTTSSYCGVRPNKIVGTLFPSDGIEAVKRKLGLVYGMNLPFPQHTQLLYTNAVVDCIVFTSLSSLLERLPSSPAHGNIYSLGILSDYELEEIEVRIAVQVPTEMVPCMLISTTHEAHLFSRMGWDGIIPENMHT